MASGRINKITEKYEAYHLRNIKDTQSSINAIYLAMVDKVFKDIAYLKYSGYAKRSINTLLNERLTKLMEGFSKEILIAIENGIDLSWGLSATKRLEIAEAQYPGISDTLRKQIADPRAKALKEFKARKVQDLKLSDRVWNRQKELKKQLTDALQRGIAEGVPAKTLATQAKQFLKDPNRSFRRVSTYDPTTGGMKLVQSAPMKNYSPGRGVYKSSLQNAQRLATTEVNMSYRAADHEAWKDDPLVKGIRIKLSNNHPAYDICDSLVGVYPPGYKHVGFHPQCRCYTVPELVNQKEYSALEDAILSGKREPKIQRVSDIPDKAKEWYEKNGKKVKGYSTTPYFIADNQKYVKKYINKG